MGRRSDTLRRRLPRQHGAVPASTGPDEVTVRLDRADFRRGSRRSRRRGALRRHWRALLALVLTVALVAAGVWALWFSPYLRAQDVAVEGADGELVAAERVQRASRLPVGLPLVQVDTDGIRERIEAIPAVEHAEVSRSWPETIRVQVTPRTPVAVVAGSDAGLQALDASGVRFGAFGTAPGRLPEVRLSGELSADVTAETTREAAAVLAALPADLYDRVAAVDVGSVDEIDLRLNGGRTVVWGSAEQSATKSDVLAVLLGDLPREVQTLDVSVPGRPTTR